MVEQIRKASEERRIRIAEMTSLIVQLTESLGEGGFFAVLAALGRIYDVTSRSSSASLPQEPPDALPAQPTQ
jgi:hypothetical protein